MKRLAVILAVLTLTTLTPAHAQTAIPTAGKVPRDAKPDLSNVPDLIEVTNDQMKIVGYAKKTDVFRIRTSGTLDVYDRNGTNLLGRVHPNGSGYVPNGQPVPAQKDTPRISGGASVATFYANPEVAFGGHLTDPYRTPTLHYCGVAHSQIGGPGADQAYGAVFTRGALWYGACSLDTLQEMLSFWLGGQVTMLRNGSVCGSSPFLLNNTRTAVFGFTARPCSDPAGWQEYRSVGGHRIYDAGTRLNRDTTTLSPWQIY